jgi:hypothetical protein
LDSIHLAQDKSPLVGLCGHDNELSGSIKGRDFYSLSDYKLLYGVNTSSTNTEYAALKRKYSTEP